MTHQAAQSFAFRRFAEGDSLNELHALVHAVFGALSIDPPSSALRETPAHFSARAKTQAIFIAAAGEQLAGAIFCEPLDGALYVGRLAVHPEWRQHGVARGLMQMTMREAHDLGAARITLQVRIALADNVRLFRSLGFVITREGSHPGYTVPTFYDMELPLASERAAGSSR